MDPLTQGVLGSVAPLALRRQGPTLRALGGAGFIAGLLPDLDVLLRSAEDPLLFLEYHRQFTHSLAFIPLGGLLASALLYPLFRRWLSLGALYVGSTLGYATHGLLDACTSYGTQLLWPFSDARIAWSQVSIVDPLFTLPLLAGVAAALWRRQRAFARAGLCWALLYLALGAFQRDRAEDAARQIATSRGHTPFRIEAKPTFANLLLWKTLYEYEGGYAVDAVRAGGRITWFEGARAPRFRLEGAFPQLGPHTRQARDVERFRWFSDDWLAPVAGDDTFVGDIRYSFLPNEIAPLWGIRVLPHAPDAHTPFENRREGARTKLGAFWRMLRGLDAREMPVAARVGAVQQPSALWARRP